MNLSVLIKSVVFNCCLLVAGTVAANDELLFGSVAMDIPAVMHKRLSPLTEYLSTKLGRPVTLKLSPNMGAAIDDTVTGKIDLTYLTPVAYIKAHEKGQARVLVKTVTDGAASFQLMIVVRNDSEINSVSDLVGKSFAFGDQKALLQQATLVNAGIQLDQLEQYKFIGHYDNIARAVLNNDFDAGILKDTTATKWTAEGLRVIYSSPQLPPYNISVSQKVSAELEAKIRAAFLELDGKNPEHLRIIKALDSNYDGFALTSDQEYDVVRKLVHPFSATKH
jgi:phosphonate transport system substrate-binding protein